jgi:hypothetical protein
MMISKKATILLGKQKCGTSCRLIRMQELLVLREINSNEYLENLKNKTLLSILDDVKVKEGDVFF